MLEPDMLMRIGSVTKQFTAGLILRLVELGKLRVTDTVSTYLPDYPGNREDDHHRAPADPHQRPAELHRASRVRTRTGATPFGGCAAGDVQGSSARIPFRGHASRTAIPATPCSARSSRRSRSSRSRKPCASTSSCPSARARRATTASSAFCRGGPTATSGTGRPTGTRHISTCRSRTLRARSFRRSTTC